MTFSGFPPEAVEFYQQLELHNTREWWVAHKATYQDAVRVPVLELAAALEDEFGPARLFRPNRDTRFSADQSPYKTHQGAFVEVTTGVGYYLHLRAEGLFVAGGFHQGEPGQVARYRAAVDDPLRGAELARVIEELSGTGLELGGDVMRTRPRGVPSDHPRVELLRHRSLIASRQAGEPPWLSTPAALDHVREDWTVLRPLVEWLAATLGPTPAGALASALNPTQDPTDVDPPGGPARGARGSGRR